MHVTSTVHILRDNCNFAVLCKHHTLHRYKDNFSIIHCSEMICVTLNYVYHFEILDLRKSSHQNFHKQMEMSNVATVLFPQKLHIICLYSCCHWCTTQLTQETAVFRSEQDDNVGAASGGLNSVADNKRIHPPSLSFLEHTCLKTSPLMRLFYKAAK
jgi:hypothetical protein